MLLTARWVLTGATPPLKDGALLIEGDTIRDLGTRTWFAKRDVGNVIDLGETILIPGLVNAHCHMEFSAPSPSPHPPPLVHQSRTISPDKRGSPPQGERVTVNFTEWVREVTKNPPSPPLSVDSLFRGGTTTVADHRSPATGRIEAPFRQVVFWEVVGASEERARQSLREARRRIEESDDDEGAQISPHSLYAVHPKVLEELLGAGAPLQSIHILESADEDQFFREGRGPLADLVRERGGEAGLGGPKLPLLTSHLLLIHGNYLSTEEIRRLRGGGVSVIHCPGSHRFFGHRPFPLRELIRSDVPVALGTDSLASSDSLSMIRQMKLMKEEFPELGEEDLLKMATIRGAEALGMEREIGTLEVGKKADVVGIPLLDRTADPYAALLLTDGINFSMVGGRVIFSHVPVA